MSIEFDPNQANEDLLPDNTWFDAAVRGANKRMSKAQNPMLVVLFDVFGGAKTVQIERFFVLNTKGGVSGLKKLCAAIGLMERYATGSMEPDELIGKNLKVLVKIQEDETGQWDAKNVAAAFMTDDSVPPQPGAPKETSATFDPAKPDEIPF